MTLDDAIAEIVRRTPLTEGDVLDLLATADDPGGIETLLRLYARQGRAPDRTAWQAFASALSEVSEVAAKAAPVVSVAVALAPLL